ncbi:MAG: methyltransferase domain-containing protein [Rhodospirillales bacterium]
MSDRSVPPNLSAFMNHLKCPDCNNGVARSRADITCNGCGRNFEITEDGILCMLPSRRKPLPAEYDDPDYKRMSAMFDDAQDYFTDGNSFFNAIHVSAHKTIQGWMRENPPAGGSWICDLGCGNGFHMRYFEGDPARLVGVDIRLESLAKCRSRSSDVILVQADLACLPFHNSVFQTMLSVYALEHVYYLAEASDEVLRVVTEGGALYVGLPCEGGLAWNLGRKLTSERTMSKRYNLDYRKYIQLEHCNDAADIVKVLRERVRHQRRAHFPFRLLPFISTNLTVTAAYTK